MAATDGVGDGAWAKPFGGEEEEEKVLCARLKVLFYIEYLWIYHKVLLTAEFFDKEQKTFFFCLFVSKESKESKEKKRRKAFTFLLSLVTCETLSKIILTTTTE